MQTSYTNFIEILRASLPSQYTIERYLDAGGQGAVFLGTCCGEEVAAKIYTPSTTDPKRIVREVDFLTSSNHPNLVKVKAFERIKHEGIFYDVVFYEYIPGGSLEQNKSLIGVEDLCGIGADIGSALEYMWGSRIVHRDIKPGNILHSNNRGYVLIDVCFARHLDRSTLTVPGGVLGTDGYRAPEQERGNRNLTIHTDIFSLGITLYEIAARSHPFSGSQYNIMQYHAGQYEYEDLSRLRTDLPRELVSIVHSMMRKVSYMRPKEISKSFKSILGG